MPRGRPSKYKPEYCEAAIEIMGEGYSVAGLAGKLGVSRSTVHQWAEDHPDFSDALSHAHAASSAWWESRLLEIAKGGEGNASVAIFGAKNRSGHDWRDKHEHTGEDGGPILFKTVIEGDGEAET